MSVANILGGIYFLVPVSVTGWHIYAESRKEKPITLIKYGLIAVTIALIVMAIVVMASSEEFAKSTGLIGFILAIISVAYIVFKFYRYEPTDREEASMTYAENMNAEIFQ